MTPRRSIAGGGLPALRAALLRVAMFLVGYELCLPVVSEDSALSVPFWATRMNIPGLFGLSVKEALLLIHAALSVPLLLRVYRERRVPASALILILFLIGGLASVVVQSWPGDVPETLRFALMAYFVLVLRDTMKSAPVDPLVGTVTAGLLTSMLLNLTLTFGSPAGRIGLLPVLYGQNGPGGAAGLFVGISSVLYRLVTNPKVRTLVVAATVVGVAVVVLSLSKLGMLMAAVGVAAWLAVSVLRSRRGVPPAALVVLLVVTLVAGIYVVRAPDSVKEQAAVIWELKFGNSGEGFFDESDQARIAYYFGTAEILLHHPLGVSYSGIGPALLETETFRRGLLKDEDSLFDVNPHNSFLYYIAANGAVGWLATILYFAWVLWATWCACRLQRGAIVTFLACTGAYVIYANTLPSFFSEFSILAYACFFLYGARRVA